MALALARKYRPRRFDDVAVQSHVASTLKGAVELGRVAQGYLLSGPRGVGKTTLARVLAMALNCENRQDGEPCGECTSCQRIWSGSASLDVVEIDAASNRGVDDARELRERAMYAPSTDTGYKVYIVDEAHMLTREAWNALLKVLEEPPPRVVFVFATTEPHKIAQTAAPVLSRVQRFDFKRIGAVDVKERLLRVLAAEGIEADAEALAMLARAADGSMRDALSLTDQVLSMGAGRITAARVRDALGLVPEDEYLALLDIVAGHRAAEIFPLVAKLADAGVDFANFLAGLGDVLRAQLEIVLGGVAPDVSEGTREALQAGKDRFSAGDLLRMIGGLTELEPRFRKSGQQQLLVETLLVRFALLDRSVELEDVLRGLAGGAGGGGPSGGGGGSGAHHAAAPASRPAARPAPPPMRASEPDRGAPRAHAEPVVSARASTAAAAAPVVAAPTPARAEGQAPPDLHRIVERWDDLVAEIRDEGKTLLATALQHASPVTVSGRGDVLIALEEPNDFYARAIEQASGELATRLRAWFSGVERVRLQRAEGEAPPPRRVTDEEVRAERLATFRKKDPVLGAAIDALDLDVVE